MREVFLIVANWLNYPTQPPHLLRDSEISQISHNYLTDISQISHRFLTEIQLSQEVTNSAVWSFYGKRHYSSSENDLAFWPHDSKHKNVNFIYIRKGYLHSDKFSWYVWKWNQNESLDFCEKSVRYLWDICEIFVRYRSHEADEEAV